VLGGVICHIHCRIVPARYWMCFMIINCCLNVKFFYTRMWRGRISHYQRKRYRILISSLSICRQILNPALIPTLYHGPDGETFFRNNNPSNSLAGIILLELSVPINVSFTTTYWCNHCVPGSFVSGI